MKLLLISIAIFYCSCSHEFLANRAASQLQRILSSEIEEGQLTKIILHPDAQITLLHIEQQHYSQLYTESVQKKISAATGEEVNRLKKDYLKVISRINLVQEQIASFLEKVSTGKDIIYSEGMAFPDNYREEFLKSYIKESATAICKLMNENGKFSYVLPSPPLFAGATFYLSKHKNRKVYGAEHRALLDLTLTTYANNELPNNLRVALISECHKEREKQIIINLTKELKELTYRQPSVRYLVCGSAHEFKDDVEIWNEAHPDNKINLLLFTPKALKKL